MPYSYTTYTGNGATTQFAVPFSYISQSHVTVLVNEVSVSFSWVNASTIQCAAAPASGAIVKIKRTTDLSTRIVDFTDGATLTEKNLDDSQLQWFYLAQECKDQVQDAVDLARTSTGQLPVSSAPTNNENTLQFTGGAVQWVAPTAARTNLDAQRTVKYAKRVRATAYNVDGGGYATANTIDSPVFSHTPTDEIGVSAGASNFTTLPAGTYRFRGTTSVYATGRSFLRLKLSDGSVIQGPTLTTDQGANLEVAGQFVVDGTTVTGVKLEWSGILANAAAYAQGASHGQSAFGDNVFSQLELWKVS